VSPSALFQAIGPKVPAKELSWHRRMAAVSTNALAAWPEEAYEAEILHQRFLGRRLLLLNAPEAIRHVLVENPGSYRRSRATIRILRPLVGEGLFLSEGEAWRFQRQTIAPALAPRVVPLLLGHVASATEEALARLGATPAPVDLLAAMQILALEVAGRSMFSLEMQQHGVAMRGLIRRFGERLGRPHLLDIVLPVAIPNLRDLARRRFRGQWLRLMDTIIASRPDAPDPDAPRDLFDLLRAARHPDTGRGFSPAELRDQVATMIVAGHETTALALFWSLYLLASAPEIQDRLAEEVRGLALTPEAGSAALPKLVYARAVVSEALRLYPPAFVMVRQCVVADRWQDVAIPERSLVMIAPWVLHRHRKFWPDPESFDPSRFLGEEPPVPKFAYLPFGVGPRVCVGAHFAMAEATLVLAMIVQRFQVARAETGSVIPTAVVTTQPDRAALFRLSLRQ
jgi:unspecific monooxygenase